MDELAVTNHHTFTAFSCVCLCVNKGLLMYRGFCAPKRLDSIHVTKMTDD